MKFAFDHYSLAELTLLIKSAERRLVELETHVSQDQAPKKRRKQKLSKVAPKYRDPDNPRNTWSGRGSQPRWLTEKVKRGHRSTDFLIPGLARPTAKKQSAVGQRTVYKAAGV